MTEMRVLMAHMDSPNQCEIETYINNGGYQAIQKAIPHIKPADLIDMVKQSGLARTRWRGFCDGGKMGFIPKDTPPPKIPSMQLR